MESKLIYLINAGNDEKYRQGVVHGTSFPHLGIVSLASMVKMYTDYNVKVFDNNVEEEKEIIENMFKDKPRVVGISVLSTSYQTALRFAKIAKNIGAITIFGNDQAAIRGKYILEKRDKVDYICSADVGEWCLVRFLEYLDGKIPIEEVPKFIYRDHGAIKENHLPELFFSDRFKILDQIPIPDRLLLSENARRRYLENYLASYPDEKVTGTGTINRFKGCSKLKKRCCYCGIADLTIRASTPELFWKDVKAAHEIGINRLFEAGDSISSFPNYLEQLLYTKPKNLSWNSFVYTSARDVNPKLVRLYKELGVFRANMGLDSGDEIMLKRLKGNNESVKKNIDAVSLLNNAGIRIYTSFVLGAPGETKESLRNTFEFIRWLIDNNLVDGTEAQPLFPAINSDAGRMLLNPNYALEKSKKEGWEIRNLKLLCEMPIKWSCHENPDPEEISKDWASIFCEVSYEELLEISRKIQDYSKKKGIATGSSWIAIGD